jgi:hypothetical protein
VPLSYSKPDDLSLTYTLLTTVRMAQTYIKICNEIKLQFLVLLISGE